MNNTMPLLACCWDCYRHNCKIWMPKPGNLDISVIANEKTNSDNLPLGPIRQFHRIWIPHEYHCDRCRHNCRIRMLKYRISVVIMNNTMSSVASLLWLLLKKFFQKLVLVCWVWITHESHGWLHCGDCCHQNCKILIKTGQLKLDLEKGITGALSIFTIFIPTTLLCAHFWRFGKSLSEIRTLEQTNK